MSNNLKEKFEFICKIEPHTNSKGEIKKIYPHRDYDDKENKELLEVGTGPFCKFKIPKDNDKRSGVYYLLVNEEIKYIGECKNLLNRFNWGYGNISPRNCYKGGQITNCRINSFILNSYIEGEEIYLFFYETDNRFRVERKLINYYQPKWNRQAGVLKKDSKKDKDIKLDKSNKNYSTKKSKYFPLKIYLMSSQKKEEILTFKEIETIIDNKLPKSAYTYDAWWSNGGHSHAKSWLDAGWMVKEFKFGDYVKFVLKDNYRNG